MPDPVIPAEPAVKPVEPVVAVEPVVTPPKVAPVEPTLIAPVEPAITEPVTKKPKTVAPVEPAVTETPAEPSVDPTTTIDDPGKVPDARIVPEIGEYALPEGAPEALAQFAHANDMTQAQLDNSLEQFGAVTQANEEATQAAIRKEGDALVTSWGDQADYNLSLVRRALAQNDPEGQLAKALETSGFGNHPAVLGYLLSVGNSMKEGGFLKSGVNIPKGKQTLANTLFGKSHPSATA